MVGGKRNSRGEDTIGAFRIVGPYFFENDNEETVTVNSERYVTMLEGFVEPQLRRLGIDPAALHFQQDEATAHTARNSMTVVREMFRTVISCFSDIVWPARSPNLSVPVIFLWEFLKQCVFQRHIMTIQELKQATVDKVAATDEDLWRCMYGNFQTHLQQCTDVNRGHLPDVIFSK